jgi:hypothetical protein
MIIIITANDTPAATPMTMVLLAKTNNYYKPVIWVSLQSSLVNNI